MRTRHATLVAPSLLLVLLVACGAPVATTPAAHPSAAAAPMLPAWQRPPRPVPAPSAVAAGAPLRAILLAQIDAYARDLIPCAAPGTPAVTCGLAIPADLRQRAPELEAYINWHDAIWYCTSDGQGGYTVINTFAYFPPTPDALRDPATLDVYVSGTPWCGVTGPR
jgi:hypothetical protein